MWQQNKISCMCNITGTHNFPEHDVGEVFIIKIQPHIVACPHFEMGEQEREAQEMEEGNGGRASSEEVIVLLRASEQLLCRAPTEPDPY